MQKVVTFQLENFAGNFRNKNAKIFEFKIGKFCWWAEGPKSFQNFWKVNIWILWLEKGQLLEWFENFQMKMAKIRPQTKLEIKYGYFDLKDLIRSLINIKTISISLFVNIIKYHWRNLIRVWIFSSWGHP